MIRALRHAVGDVVGRLTPLLSYAPVESPGEAQRLLVLGVYLADRSNSADHLVGEFASSRRHAVTQAWAALGSATVSPRVERATPLRSAERVPKFAMLNRLLARHDMAGFDHVICCDDDVRLRHGFVDAYLAWHRRAGLALSQPARTRASYASWKQIRRQRGSHVRRVDFVEIGPVFCVSRAAFPLIFPFDETSPMGYGYDLVWPVRLRAAGLRMGTIDACPIDHTLRPVGKTYAQSSQLAGMARYLEQNEHLGQEEAMRRAEVVF